MRKKSGSATMKAKGASGKAFSKGAGVKKKKVKHVAL
jgi:hypothetical protein